MVVEEAKRLGYKRNPVAMNLKMGRTNTIGVIVPEMHTPYAATVINGIHEVLYKQNQKVMIAESDENAERELENLKMMEQFMVDGLIVSLCSYRKNIEEYRKLAEDGMASSTTASLMAWICRRYWSMTMSILILWWSI